jgi:hypothetical protein
MPQPSSPFPRIVHFIGLLVVSVIVSAPSFAQTGAQTKDQPPEESFDTFHLEHLTFLKMSATAEKTVLQQNVAAAMAAAIHSAPHEEDKEQAPKVQSQAAASKAMGFPVAIVSARKDQPEFQIEKKETIDFTVDLASLQEMLDQAKRPDLLLPASFDQAHVQIKIPQSLVQVYGQCGGTGATNDKPTPVSEDTQTHASQISQSDDSDDMETDNAEQPQVTSAKVERQAEKTPPESNPCLIFFQMPVPEARISSSMRFPLVMQTLAQLVGSSEDQENAVSTSIDWTNTFPVPLPPTLATAEELQLSGADATLIRLRKQEGQITPFFLVWIRDGKIYALLGPGELNNAKALADSVQ